jgi:hypothetical protein
MTLLTLIKQYAAVKYNYIRLRRQLKYAAGTTAFQTLNVH